MKIGIWAFFESFPTGEANVTKKVGEVLSRRLEIQYLNSSSLKVVGILRGLIAARHVDRIYVVPARSWQGMLRDVCVRIFFGDKIRVVHIHGNDLLFAGKLRVKCFATLWKRYLLVAPSQRTLSFFSDHAFSRLDLVPNFTNVKGDGAARGQEGVVQIVWNSNVMIEKGFDDFCSTVLFLSRRFEDLRFKVKIFGSVQDSRSKLELVRFRNNAGKNLQVEYLGVQDSDSIVRHLHDSDLFIFPSRYKTECQPLALIDAIACSLPIVAYDHPASVETLRSYPSWQVECGDSESFKSAASFALMRIGGQGCQSSSSNEEAKYYSYNNFVDNVDLKIVSELVI